MQTLFTIFVFTILIGFVAYKAYRFFTGISNAVTGKIKIDKNSTLSPEQYRKLALGAIYSQQQQAPHNTLKTGRGRMRATALLGEWWSIYSGKDAKDKLEQLLDSGFRHYDILIELVAQQANPAQIQTDILDTFAPGDEQQQALHRLQNLRDCLDDLNKRGYLEKPASRTAAAWDYGRVVFVARLCFDARFLTEQEAWSFIERANEMAAQHFDGWRSFAHSYVIGRAMWSGDEFINDGIAIIAEGLLAAPESPFNQLAWK